MRRLYPALAALDFLYLDYKPPSSLDLVITPAILHKYNAIFSHLLRLVRVEAVARNITLDVSKPNLVSTRTGRHGDGRRRDLLLDSNPTARRELLALVFEVRGIVSSLCSYSFVGAVEENWKLFRKALDRVEKASMAREGHGGRHRSVHMDEEEGEEEQEAWNLDSLESLHQHFLDRVQQALLLKQKQAPLLKIIQSGIFGVVLGLGRMIKEWRRKEGMDGWEEVSKGVRSEIRGMHKRLRGQASMLVSHFLRSYVDEKAELCIDRSKFCKRSTIADRRSLRRSPSPTRKRHCRRSSTFRSIEDRATSKNYSSGSTPTSSTPAWGSERDG
jgi:hypothetical protein